VSGVKKYVRSAPRNGLDAPQGRRQECSIGLSCHVGDEAIETKVVEHAAEVVAERHQAPFAAGLVEATNKEVPVAGAAFDGLERMLEIAKRRRIKSSARCILARCRSRTSSCSERAMVR
jgi:hypothetical protein